MSQITSEQRKAAKDINTPEAELKSLAELDTELARLVSRNDSATDALLQHLGSHSDATVRKWVATHPATPVNVLLKLGQQFPEQLLQNPILDFLFLENPALLNEFPIGTVRAALKRKSAPRAMLEHGLNLEDESAHLALAQNPAAPEELIDTLMKKTSYESVKEAIEARRQTEPSIEAANEMFFEALCERMAEYSDKKAESKCFEALLALPDIHAECITRLLDAKSKNQFHEDLEALTEEQNPLVLRALAKRTDLSIKAMLAMLPKLTEASLKDITSAKTQHPEILRALHTSKHISIRKLVASHPKTPPDVLEILLHDASSEVSNASACNKNVCIDALDRAADHLLVDNVEVIKRLIEADYLPALILLHRDKLAYNPAVPQSVRAQLVADLDVWGRASVTENPSTPPNMLTQLATDKNGIVRQAVAENPNKTSDVFAQLATDRDTMVRERVARNPSAPSDILVQLATDRHEWVRERVAQNPNTPADILAQLAMDKSEIVRAGVAENSKANSSILSKLADDKSKKVRAGVAENPAVSSDVLNQLAIDKNEAIKRCAIKNPNTPSYTLIHFAKDEKYGVRVIVAEHINTPPDVLVELAADKDQRVREAIAKNPNTQSGVLNRLAEDKNERIREKVTQNPNTLADTLDRLSTDKAYNVRMKVAENTNTPLEALTRLTADKEYFVRIGVAQNTNTPSYVLSQLVADRSVLVREEAIYNQNQSPKLLNDILTGKVPIKSGMLGACIRSAHFYPTIEPYMPEVLARLKGESLRN